MMSLNEEQVWTLPGVEEAYTVSRYSIPVAFLPEAWLLTPVIRSEFQNRTLDPVLIKHTVSAVTTCNHRGLLNQPELHFEG